jgi:Cu2+-exporting ATPase
MSRMLGQVDGGSAGIACAEVSCSHCSLPVPAGLIKADADHQFCCQACETAYGVIHACGLDAYYRLREATDPSPGPAHSTGKEFREFDDPTFTRLYVQGLPGGLMRTKLLLQNLHCAACVWLIEKLPAVVSGVVEARLDFRRSTVEVTWDPAQVALSRIARGLDSLGYPAFPAKEGAAQHARTTEDRRFMMCLAIAGAIAGNVMLLAFALYAGVFGGMQSSYEAMFRWLSMVLGILSLAWPGSIFFRNAWAAVRTRTAHLDLPITLGLLVGGICGLINTIRGSGEIYFDSLTVLVFLLLVGRFIQHRQQRWAVDAIELLFSLTPTSARRLEDGVAKDVPIEALVRGNTVEIRAGDSVPADGVIVEGSSQVDQSLLTGESRPVSVRVGERVAAGAVNLSSALHVRVEATGEQTRVGRLMKLVADAASRKAPLVRFADRISGIFVVAMLGLSLVTLAVWLVLDPSRAVNNATSLLIVTCPCALGLATPLAFTIAIGRAARRGILIKGGDALEHLARPGRIFLDKTGTLTQGRISLVSWRGQPLARAVLGAMEKFSSHPIATALFASFGSDADAAGFQTVTVAAIAGGGLEANVDGVHALAGSLALMRSRGIALAPEFEREVNAVLRRDNTPVLIALDGRCAGVAGLGDALRPDASKAVRTLQRAGWQVEILSGDHPTVVMAVGNQLGLATLDCCGGLSPEQKLETVQDAAQQGPVVMVGDGVNDAAALSAATVGIAIAGGAEASLAAADIYLQRPDLALLTDLLQASRRTIRAIRWCLGASIFYNAIAATLAMTGLINPIIAAVLMPASSLTVLTLAYRARTFDVARPRPDRPARATRPTAQEPAPCP